MCNEGRWNDFIRKIDWNEHSGGKLYLLKVWCLYYRVNNRQVNANILIILQFLYLLFKFFGIIIAMQCWIIIIIKFLHRKTLSKSFFQIARSSLKKRDAENSSNYSPITLYTDKKNKVIYIIGYSTLNRVSYYDKAR